jgi:mercuric reductase
MGKSSETARGRERFTVELQPGVLFPDWSVVRSPRALEAFVAHLRASNLEHRWRGYTAREDRVRRAVLEGYLQLGRAAGLPWLAKRTGLLPEEVCRITRRLAARDIVILDGDRGRIVGAYPFTDRPSEHRVRLGGRTLRAMCAVDALGVGSMCQADVVIESRCRACKLAVRLATRRRGTALATVDPPTTTTWFGLHYAGGCAATSLCRVIAFFCSDAHLDAWRAEQGPETRGHRLTPDDALQIGRGLFGPALCASRPATHASAEGSHGG